MKKRLKSKDAKKEIYKPKSNDNLSLIKKLSSSKTNINNNNNNKRFNKNWKNYN